MITENIFKAYDIRGKYPSEINEEVAELVGNVTVQYLSKSLRKKRLKILVCRDVRVSSESLRNALVKGIALAGAEVIDVGVGTTPYFYFLMQRYVKPDGGIMVTASHNPAEYNGFKIRSRGGKEISMGSGLENIKKSALLGKFKHLNLFETVNFKTYTDEYIKFLQRDIKIEPIRIVVDAGGGSAALFLPKLLDYFPKLLYKPLFFELDGSFKKHPPNPLLPEAQQFVKEELKGGQFRFGAVFDGDGDRVLFFDEMGNFVRSEYIIALLAADILKKSPGSTFVFPVNTSRGAREYIQELGGKIKLSRVGQNSMSEAMRKSHAPLGGELSGHFYFQDFFYKDSSFMALLRLIQFLSHTHRQLSQLVKPVDERYFSSGGEINFYVKDKMAVLGRLKKFYKDAKMNFLDGITVEYPEWWFNVRPSNTEPFMRLVVEAKDEKLYKEKVKEVENLVKE